MPRKARKQKRLPRVVPSPRVSLTLPLPRPRGVQGMKIGKLPVPDLMCLYGMTLGCPFGLPTRDFAGWRLFVNVDDAPLVDGENLTTVDRAILAASSAVRSESVQIRILTPRDEPVDVVVGVEWHGRGKPRRLPKGVEVTIHGRR